MTTVPAAGFRVGPDGDPDKYVIGPAVAGGAEGVLYRGSLTIAGFDSPVAVKMLQPRFLAQVEEWHVRWSEQVELLRSVQGPGVVGVRDGFMGALPHPPGEAGQGRSLYLVMNWVDGEPLDEWVRHHRDRDPFDALRLLVNVAAALDLMHSGHNTGGVAVIHRDVKPANIIITAKGESVLVDFGLTRGLPTGRRLSGVTGTPGYLAPEATEEGVYSAASDRYALGAVAYFVFTGVEPPTTHQPQVLRAALSAVDALAGRPEAVEHLMAMLADDPAARPEPLANWVAQLRRSSLAGLPEVLQPVASARNPGPDDKHLPQGAGPDPPARREHPTKIAATGVGARPPRRRATPARLALTALVVLATTAAAIHFRTWPLTPTGTPSGNHSTASVADHTQPVGTPLTTIELSQTSVRTFQPFALDGTVQSDLTVTAAIVGSCPTGSLVAYGRPDAWRCFSKSTVHDPCFAPSALPKFLVCATDAFSNNVVKITPDGALPREKNPPHLPATPWELELVTGDRCVFQSGAAGVVEGERANYACSSGASVIGSVDVSGAVWSAMVQYPGTSSIVPVPVRIAYR